MDPQREIAMMPGPQWLFGFEISESQRLLFARLYLEFAASDPEIPPHLRGTSSLGSFLDRCALRGLQPTVARERAIDILRRPSVFGWTAEMQTLPGGSGRLRSQAAIERARAVLDRSRGRLTRARR